MPLGWLLAFQSHGLRAFAGGLKRGLALSHLNEVKLWHCVMFAALLLSILAQKRIAASN